MMFTSVTGQDSSIPQHLYTAKKALQDAILDAGIVSTTADGVEVDDLERDALEILRLIRSLRNRLAPINRIPPEILTLIPDFLDPLSRDRGVIALSHICQVWREMFISRSSLWSNFACMDADKTRVYLERSGSSPINLRLRRGFGLSSLDSFFQITSQAISRLKFLSVDLVPENLQAITAHISHPAPLLEMLNIDGGSYHLPWNNPALASTIFDGDLSSLRVLRLEYVRTELPWRNMVNLTSFTLRHISTGGFTIGRLLDFFASAPRLRKIDLYNAKPTSDGENGRLVSLEHLKRVDIIKCEYTSTLLDHLVVPVGAKLRAQLDPHGFIIEDHIPRFLDNLKNLSSFTKIHLYLDGLLPCMRLSGPNGQFCIVTTIMDTKTSLLFESLARFDTSKAERLKICGRIPLFRIPHGTLLPMKSLRTLVLFRGDGLSTFAGALNPNANPWKEVVCPSLEQLIFILRTDKEFDIQGVIEVAAVRASRGVKLRAVVIIGDKELDVADVLEFRRHALRVEYGREVDAGDYDSKSDDSGEED